MQNTFSNPPRFAVFGHPVAHSLSPRIHTYFAAQTNRAMHYEAIDASISTFTTQWQAFVAAQGCGANITLPLKSIACAQCSELSNFAQRVGAVNTLSRNPEGCWRGDNTDGLGLVRDLTERHALDLRGRRCLLLGAGGAARAVAFALLDAGIAELVIVNRSPERADQLADAIGDPVRVHTRYWQDLAQCGSFELLVNATSAGLQGVSFSLPFSLLTPRAVCYDVAYGKAAQGFVAWAQAAGAQQVFDGLGMLIEQAAESFAIWQGIRPETDALYNQLRRELPLEATD